MIGQHRVMVYADRLAGNWSAPILPNPYFTANIVGWAPEPFAGTWAWQAPGVAAQTNTTRGGFCNDPTQPPVARNAIATRYRLRAVISVNASTVVYARLNFGSTAEGASWGPFWRPAASMEVAWAGFAVQAGTTTLTATFDLTGVDAAMAYPYVGTNWLVNDPTTAPRFDSIELAYQGSPGVDLSCLVDQVSITHGRDDSTQQPEPASATLDLSRDADGFDLPAALEVGAVVKVTTTTSTGVATDYDRFVGRVTDLNLGWEDAGEDTPEEATGQVIAVALMADLARRVVGDTPWPQELDGARVARIMNQAGAPLDPAWSDPGTVQVLPRDVDKQAALELARGTAESATGLVWHTRGGEVRYADSDHRRGVTAKAVLDACDLLVSPVWRRNLEGLVNDVTLAYGDDGAGEQPTYSASSAASIAQYGRYAYSLTTQLAALADAQAMATLLLARNSSPVWILAALPVDMAGVDPDTYAALLTAEVGDLVTVTGLPVIGTAPTTTTLWVEGWHETLAAGVHDFELVVSGYCRTSPPPRWDDLPSTYTWDGMSPAITWDSASCLGPLPSEGRWNDVPASTRWDAVAAATTWDTWKG